MVELDSIIVVLLLEAVIAFFLVLITVYLFARGKSKGDQLVSNKVIAKLKKTGSKKSEKLSALINAHVDIDSVELNEILAEMESSERQLYKQIIKMYLKRDVNALLSIDKRIDDFSEPYFKIMGYSVAKTGDTDKQQMDEKKVQLLTEQNEQISEQLTIAMTTIDEISAEYSKVFAGTQTELELANSSKKMMDLFKQASQKIATLSLEEGGSSL